MKLAITQIILGVLIIGSLVWFVGWVEPDSGSFVKLVEGYEVELLPLPGWITQVIFWKAVSFVIGVAILGCGITQCLRAKGIA
jgi:hypothetical protein